MSYRNPKIIDDKSGLIVSQAINQATASLGQGIVAYGAEQKKRREKEALKQKKDAQTIISLANMSSENAALFNNGLKDMSENVRGILITRNERTLKRINEIYIEQQVNNNASPALSKELGFLKGQIAQGNDLAKSIFQTSGQLSDILQDPNAFNDRRKFFKADEDGSTEKSEAMIYGFGGRDGYEGSMVEDKNGQLYAQVYVKESGKTFKIEATEFGQISNDFILNKETNASVEQVEFTQNEFFKDGELIPGFVRDAEPFSVIENGKRITGTRQYLNEKQVIDTKDLAVANTVSKIVGLNGSLQIQNEYIKDLGLDPEKYQEKDTEGRAKYIGDRSSEIFKDNSSLKKNEKGYYFDTNVESYNLPAATKPTVKQDDAKYWKNNTANLFATTKLSTEDTNRRTTASIMPEVIPVQIGSSFQGGKITNLEWNADSVTVSYSGSSDEEADPNALGTLGAAASAPSTPGSVTLKYNNVTNMTTLAESVGGSLKDPRAARVLAVQIANNNK